MRIVLVVDDEPMLRVIAVEMLEEAGDVVAEFSTAAQAIASCDVPGSDVATIVTDSNMPGDRDGLDLARHLRETRPDTHVVVTLGRYDALPADIKKDVTSLSKPWTGDLLLSAIGLPS